MNLVSVPNASYDDHSTRAITHNDPDSYEHLQATHDESVRFVSHIHLSSTAR
jgi:hypothetical protein